MSRPHLLFVLTLLTAASIHAADTNEVLNKSNAKYYGRRSASNSKKFITCHGGEMDIEPGEVKPTLKQCVDPIVGPITGIIRALDSEEGILVVGDSNGNTLTFKLTLSERKRLKKTDIGRNITIKVDRTITVP
jgi:hypothetical protein